MRRHAPGATRRGAGSGGLWTISVRGLCRGYNLKHGSIPLGEGAAYNTVKTPTTRRSAPVALKLGGQRRATDIAEADEEDAVGHAGLSRSSRRRPGSRCKRHGWLKDCCGQIPETLSNLDQWRSLKRKGVIKSRNGGPYVVNRDGLSRLRSRADNRTSGRSF